MRLYVEDDNKNKIYLNKKAINREELQSLIGSSQLKLNEKTYELSEVFAEPDSVASTSVLAGGIVGLFGGVLGVIAGSVAGGIIGTQVEKNEKNMANRFNQSGLVE
ncbi:hypothetical protein [Aliarcobacter butzleri]|uniref:Uncharacterized protein n=1 Tax=Aliarcobacter butzleri L351 TaxID=1447259 RepID=A0A837J4S1_9BACT|nr:hypothetical protein [Aliarcobacter butzleri]KLE00249.1 hypothetical protein AF76_08255 [Aliarcobacter butzleri L351]KLE13267.1 hypothetical protein AF75_04575 [Aliarcobacter butzleri L350]MDN5073765.1 hypothetical protein [Aliarcobacter butzleri]MDN5122261.1 hypothetical protein [Aliarcobacter butzleri]